MSVAARPQSQVGIIKDASGLNQRELEVQVKLTEALLTITAVVGIVSPTFPFMTLFFNAQLVQPGKADSSLVMCKTQQFY